MWRIDSLDMLVQAKRRIYLLAWPFGAAALLTAWIFKSATGGASAIESLLFPACAAYLAYMALALLSSRSERAVTGVERSLFLVVALSLLVRYGDILFFAPAAERDAALADLLYWIPMVYVLAHLTFNRYGTRVCLIYFGALTAVGILYAWREISSGRANDMLLLTRFCLGNAAYIVLLIICAKLKDLYARATSHAQNMARLANTDVLVGLPNRRHLQSALQRELERARRFKRGLSVVFFDLDQFKHINDQFGHDVGDEVLRAVAAVVRSQLRPSDELGRWGGDEFLLIVPELDAAAAEQMAARVRSVVAAHPVEAVGRLSASFGLAAYPPFDSVEGLLRAADRALARAKAMGKNRVEVEA